MINHTSAQGKGLGNPVASIVITQRRLTTGWVKTGESLSCCTLSKRMNNKISNKVKHDNSVLAQSNEWNLMPA